MDVFYELLANRAALRCDALYGNAIKRDFYVIIDDPNKWKEQKRLSQWRKPFLILSSI